MTQTKVIALVLLAVTVLGGTYFMLSRKSASTDLAIVPTSPEVVGDSSSAPTPSGRKMAFLDFVKQGGAHKCIVNQSIGGMEVKGTTYINDGMIRGEYATEAQGMSMESTLIVRDGYTYTWTSMAPQMGFKTKVAAGTPTDTGAGMSGTYSFDAQQIGEYDCESWVVDEGKFTPPASVTFTEIK